MAGCRLNVLLVLFFAQLSAQAAHAARFPHSRVELKTFTSHSRLSFKLDTGAQTEWKDLPGGFELHFKGLSLRELGGPIRSPIIDSRLGSLTLTETLEGVLVRGKWKFPTGDAAPADPQMEHFDYRQETPPRLVVDFWPKKGPTTAELRILKRRKDRDEALKKSAAEAKVRAERKIASEKARADADDVTKFCRVPVSEETDIFLPFMPAHEKVEFSRWLATTTPDSQFPYFEPKTNEEDSQYVRLALELYRQGKHGLVIRTLDFFERDHSKSQFLHEMRFLKANAMIKLGHEEDALRILKELTIDAKTSAVALHAGMFIAVKLLEKGTHLLALESFLWLIHHYPENRLSWVFHLGAAEALFALRQTDRAAKEYQWVMENAPKRMNQAEGAMRMGDLYLVRFQYERALAAYYQGLSHFKDESKDFPKIHLNRAETLYWIGQLDRAEESFLKFLKDYPGHPAGWRATIRLAEIYGRQPAEEGRKKMHQWLYETINQFPFSAGATVARARILPCGDHGGFDFEAAQRFFNSEATQFKGAHAGGEVEVNLEHYKEFIGLSHVRTLVTMGQEEAAIDVALEQLKDKRRVGSRQALTHMLEVLSRKYVLKLLDQGKKYEALAFFEDKADLINRLDRSKDPNFRETIHYLLKLSQAAADLGMGALAEKLTNDFRVAEASHLKKTGRVPAENAPKDLDSLLKQSEQACTEAKALWVKAIGTIEPEAEKKIRDLLTQVHEESRYSYEKELILGLLEQKAGRPEAALKHVIKAQLLAPADASQADSLRVSAWLAGLQAKVGSPDSALQLYQQILRDLAGSEKKPGVVTAETLGVPPVPSHEQLVIHEGEILARQGKWGEAAAAYGRAIEDGSSGNQMMFEYARALRKSGTPESLAKSNATLEKLSQSKQEDFWKKLAQETLQGTLAGQDSLSQGGR